MNNGFWLFTCEKSGLAQLKPTDAEQAKDQPIQKTGES
jgi:hypothetical protein